MFNPNLNTYSLKIASGIFIFSAVLFFSSCKKDILSERPLSSLSSDLALTSKSGFNAYLIALHAAAREELTQDNATFWTNFNGTDMFSSAGAEYSTYANWVTWLTPTRAEVVTYWNWAYSKMIVLANTIIVYANKPELSNMWQNEAEKNAVLAEAKFFRAYTYNILANLYGGVPIVDTIFASPKFDFVRSSRADVYSFAAADLEFASKWLPATVSSSNEGRIVKAAADHLLSEVYISLGQYDKAVASATDVIGSGLYKLMDTRFGVNKDKPGDPFSDLFLEGNMNRSSGNLEAIYVWQIEEYTDGGSGTSGNRMLGNFGPFLVNIKDPAGFNLIATDSMGRGVGRARPSNYTTYEIWKDNWDNDMRNSPYNMRRVFYYTNPASPYFGQVVNRAVLGKEDTLRRLYDYSRKVEGRPWNNTNTSGRTSKDVYVYRLAETYLLRAEAYFRKGDLPNAALDINAVRERANAHPVAASDVSLDYILDERARELMTEEPRRRTLIRMGKLVERIRKYDIVESSRASVKDYHNLYPIPQTAIDANTGAVLEQNPGY